jgi:ABC-type phosphate/phosphonate transport system permease subunit
MNSPRNNDEAGHELPAYSEHQQTGPKSNFIRMRLGHSSSPLIIAIAYSTLLLFSWIVTAVSTQRPLELAGYRYEDFDRTPFWLERDLATSRRFFDAAQVVTSIADTLTIPVISTVVAAAVAVRLQRDVKRRHTLRQVALLADRSWNSPLSMLTALLRPRAHLSYLLVAGVLLTVLGTSIGACG